MAAAGCFLAACKGPATVNTSSDSAAATLTKNKQTAMNSEMAMIKMDMDGVYKDCSPDFVDYGNGESKPVKSIDSLKANMKTFFAAFPDFKGENLRAVADSDMVIVTGDWSGTFKAEFMKIKPTNKVFKAADADIFTFNKEGKITSHKSIQSEMTYLYQLGVPMPAKK